MENPISRGARSGFKRDQRKWEQVESKITGIREVRFPNTSCDFLVTLKCSGYRIVFVPSGEKGMIGPESDSYDLKKRTRLFAVQVIQLSKAFPKNFESQYIRNQLIRSAASVAANYRAARRGRSRKEFIAKLSIVIEECDEACFWMELAIELGLVKSECCSSTLQEGSELTAIFIVSRNTARKRLADETRPTPRRSRTPVIP